MEMTMKNAFDNRMQVLGFKNREISVIWNVISELESAKIPASDFQYACVILKNRVR